jgi:hypothetical protein
MIISFGTIMVGTKQFLGLNLWLWNMEVILLTNGVFQQYCQLTEQVTMTQ